MFQQEGDLMAKKITKTEESEPQKVESIFSKEQLLSSNRFQDRRDILNAILKPDKRYTVEDVEQEISKYMKGQVK